MNEILWELINFMFIQPLILIGIIFAIVVVLPISLIVIISFLRQPHDTNTGTQLGGSFYDDACFPYSETDDLDSKSPVEEMLDGQLALEDEERYFGLDYGFLDDVEHLSDY